MISFPSSSFSCFLTRYSLLLVFADLMVDGHLLVANYFASMPDTHIRKIEEYPYQLCHCVSSYPDLSDQMETYLLKTEVFREMADLRFHSDLCGYWKVICSEPGSAVEIVGKYMGSFQVIFSPRKGRHEIILNSSSSCRISCSKQETRGSFQNSVSLLDFSWRIWDSTGLRSGSLK